jgi:hypothetical protein
MLVQTRLYEGEVPHLVYVFWANFSFGEIPFWKKLCLAFCYEVSQKLDEISKKKQDWLAPVQLLHRFIEFSSKLWQRTGELDRRKEGLKKKVVKIKKKNIEKKLQLKKI